MARGTPKTFLYAGKTLQVVSLFLSQHFGQHLQLHKARHEASSSMSPRLTSLCNMRLSALYDNGCVVSSVSSLCAIVYCITIAPYNSKILCLLKRARKGASSSGLFIRFIH